MKVLILTSPHHIYSNYIIKKVLAREDVCEVVGVIQSTALLPGKSFLSSVRSYLRKAGPWFFLVQASKSWAYRTSCALNRLSGNTDIDHISYDYWRILKNRSIPLYDTSDINCVDTQSFINSCQPDLILIIFFGLILDRKTISIPPQGVINIHPSLLPKYRGLMPVFQALRNKEKETGITVHIVDESIDSGPIIRQIKVKIQKGDTEHSLYAYLCVQISKILPEILKEMVDFRPSRKFLTGETPGSYFSIPDHASVRDFRRNGNMFFTFSQLMSPFESFRSNS